MTDFFISYTHVDRSWAEWIAWQLEAAGYTTVIQAWDFRPGVNFAVAMQHAAAESARTIAVLSPAYLQSVFTTAEWGAAFARDPTGTQRLLLPVRIRDCEPRGLLPQIVYIDLVGLEIEAARDTLLAGVQRQRAKPTREPGFPGHSLRSVTEPPLFPGSIPRTTPFLDHITVGPDHTLREGTIQQYFGEMPRPDSASRNRRAMIEKVWTNWITGVLQPSLPNDILLELGLTEHPAMVARALDLYVQRPDHADHVQEPSTRLIDIFDRLDHALLILGGPGAGKTTLLLTLARELLVRAAQNPEQPIPVVFPLSAWAQQRRPLADWLVDALHEQYDVPRKLGQAWIAVDAILPLLDGLDEVAPEHRAGCVEAVNTFRRDHGLVPIAVCSRVADYEALGTRLRLPGAIVVLPLTPPQVDSYLTQVGPPVAAVRAALQEDPTLWELLDTPLMLTIATLAYRGEPIGTLPTHASPEVQRHHLFAVYVNRMFQRPSIITPYTRQQTERWLTWLAEAMQRHNQSVFYLEWMQPDWLPGQGQQRLVTFITSVMSGLLFGLFFGLHSGLYGGLQGGLRSGLFGGLLGGVGVGIRSSLVGGLLFGLLGGLLFGLLGGLGSGLVGWLHVMLVGYSNEIKPIEKIGWSWSAAQSTWISTLFKSLGSGLFVGLLGGLRSGLLFGLLGGLFVALLVGLGGWLKDGFIVGEIRTHSFPNEGIRRSVRNALMSGLNVGLFFVLSIELFLVLSMGLSDWLDKLGGTLLFALPVGLLFGLLFGLRFGGRVCLHHFALRLVLWHKNFAPLHYIRFLDYATGRIFLRKVGGGYVFVHRILLEYFAARHQMPAERQKCNGNG